MESSLLLPPRSTTELLFTEQIYPFPAMNCAEVRILPAIQCSRTLKTTPPTAASVCLHHVCTDGIGDPNPNSGVVAFATAGLMESIVHYKAYNQLAHSYVHS